jgi:hypothetical protein
VSASSRAKATDGVALHTVREMRSARLPSEQGAQPRAMAKPLERPSTDAVYKSQLKPPAAMHSLRISSFSRLPMYQ